MKLVELNAVPDAALPVARLRDHLRLGRGFGPDAGMDALLAEMLRAALAGVERRTGKAVLIRDFMWQVTAWRDRAAQPLPLAPVVSVDGIVMRRAGGEAVTLGAETYRVIADAHRPVLQGIPFLPVLSGGDLAEVTLTAGYGGAFTDLPPDLGQAVIALAAHLYESRGRGLDDFVPGRVLEMIAPYRSVRLFGGGA